VTGARFALAVAMTLMLGACTVASSPSSSPKSSARPTGPMLTPTDRPSAEATPEVSEAGRPFDAETLLRAMRESRRPDGVPDALETEDVAARLAEAIWTVDGRPWATLSAGGSCGPESCTLEVGGAHTGAEGEDVWTFTVIPATGSVERSSATLRSLPTALVTRLDDVARGLHPLPDERGLLLGAAAWQPPPDDGRFVLSYRSGDETGCALELTIDLANGQLVDESAAGC
jgi:hypothetical protein